MKKQTMIIQPNQIRAGRALLDWTVSDLAQKVGVAMSTVSAIETGRSAGSLEVITAIVYAFQSAGIELTEAGGVEPSRSKISNYKNHEGFKAFFDNVYEVASNHPDPDICITNVDEAEYQRWLGSYDAVHYQRMSTLNKTKFRVLVKEQDFNLISTSYCEYKWINENSFADLSMYIYGDKVAFIEFSDQTVAVTVVHNKAVTDAQRKMFNVAWQHALSTPNS